MRRLSFIPLLLVILLSACGGDDGVSPEPNIIGTWVFVEFENLGSGTVTVVEHTITFTATTATIVFTAGDCTETATYSRVDGALTLTVTSVDGLDCVDDIGQVLELQATVSGDTLRLAFFDSITAFISVYARVA